ncbi:hypothetical protein BT96DRAFT_997785 [Gymnopus androsaceus JB14]|uniref:Aminoglycoside phosphotransferase domain-containing protein n=1 Tax=Gymnopus androsaceus JB14 TaxID=1447944 RepID=A0A6A4HDZ9_9AGAR|nr:hypothetical protein BT96DRAFT_997785 [Gymnopus androsaceus JB14]
MVANMDLARTKVPVPRVLRYGYSGNCSYILMEKIPYLNFSTAMEVWKLDYMPVQVTYWIDYIVRELATLGLSHNDLFPRNILVDGNGTIVSIIDWDSCTPLHAGVEYARMIRSHDPDDLDDPGVQDWYHIFLRHSFDRTGEEIAIGCSKRHPKLSRQWPLVKSKASQQLSSPVTDPRNQSFSRQKICPVRSRSRRK